MCGPWVTTEYFDAPEKAEASVEESGWLHTGDIICVDKEEYTEVVNRLDDPVKSGSEWISSVEVKNRIIGHEDVEAATVVPVDHPTWDERPVAFVVAMEDVEDSVSTRLAVKDFADDVNVSD